MELGLYNAKYPFRKLIGGMLPFFKDISPNAISYLLLPVGAGIAQCYYFSDEGIPQLYLIAILLIGLRMFLGTMDGLVAEHFKKGSPSGEIINRLLPEISDVLYLLGLTLAKPEYLLPGIFAIVAAWLTTFSGLVGLAIKKPIQSVGPAGQTDRLAALILCSFLQYFSLRSGWDIDFLEIFLYWCSLGGVITVTLRLKRILHN